MPTKPQPLTLAQLIREYQDQTGYSLQDIAEKTGLSKPKIGVIAKPRGKTLLRLDSMQKIAIGLGIPLSTVRRAAANQAGKPELVQNKNGSEQLIRAQEQLEDLPEDKLPLAQAILKAIAEN